MTTGNYPEDLIENILNRVANDDFDSLACCREVSRHFLHLATCIPHVTIPIYHYDDDIGSGSALPNTGFVHNLVASVMGDEYAQEALSRVARHRREYSDAVRRTSAKVRQAGSKIIGRYPGLSQVTCGKIFKPLRKLRRYLFGPAEIELIPRGVTGLRVLTLVLPSGELDYHADKVAFIKWSAEFGSMLNACVILGASRNPEASTTQQPPPNKVADEENHGDAAVEVAMNLNEKLTS